MNSGSLWSEISQVCVSGWPLRVPFWRPLSWFWDDSTSALDYLTEARLLKSIRKELGDTGLILVSQRTNSLKSADQIFSLEQGTSVGPGNHDFLLSTNEIYQEIHYSQHGREEAWVKNVPSYVNIILEICSPSRAPDSNIGHRFKSSVTVWLRSWSGHAVDLVINHKRDESLMARFDPNGSGHCIIPWSNILVFTINWSIGLAKA